MEKIICIILLVLYGVIMLMMCCIALLKRKGKPKNKVHFYIAKNSNGERLLFLGKPVRNKYKGTWNTAYPFGVLLAVDDPRSLTPFSYYYIEKNYDNLTWDDEPIEVFLNLEG